MVIRSGSSAYRLAFSILEMRLEYMRPSSTFSVVVRLAPDGLDSRTLGYPSICEGKRVHLAPVGRIARRARGPPQVLRSVRAIGHRTRGRRLRRRESTRNAATKIRRCAPQMARAAQQGPLRIQDERSRRRQDG